MSISVIASTVAASPDTNVVTSLPIDTTGSNLIVISGLSFDPTYPIVLTDSKSNTWTRLTVYFNAIASVLYYCASPVVGSGHTFTLTTTAGLGYPSVGVLAVNGADISPFESQNGSSLNGVNTSIQPGAVTPAEDNCLICSSLNAYSGTSIAIDSGFTKATVEALGGNLAGGIGWKILGAGSSGTPVNPTWSWTTGGLAASSIAIFKPAPPAPPSGQLGSLGMMGIGN